MMPAISAADNTTNDELGMTTANDTLSTQIDEDEPLNNYYYDGDPNYYDPNEYGTFFLWGACT